LWRFNFIASKFFDMKFAFLLSLIFCCSSPIIAQFGINIGYKFTEARTWQIVTDNYISNRHLNILNQGTTGGLDYTFPTKSSFLVLQPNIQFTRLTSNLLHYQTLDGYNFELFNFSLQLNVNIYLINFGEESDLKDNPKLFSKRRGFFIQVSPAIDHFRTQLVHPEINETGETTGNIAKTSAVDFSYSLGFRAGIDLKWHPNFKITPLFGFRFFPRVDWKDLTEITTKGVETGSFDFSSITQYSIGLRIGFDLK